MLDSLHDEGALAVENLPCQHCGKPVLDGQARYALNDNHYDCEFPKGQPPVLSLREVVATLDNARESLPGLTGPTKAPRAPAGQGALALKVRGMVFEALKVHLEGEPTEVVMWVQPPEYRGPRWDLACWGLDCKYGTRQVSVHSWDTMTRCAKAKRLVATPEGALSFDVGPASEAGEAP